MVEGGSSKDFSTIKKMLYTRPDLLKRILEVNAASVAAYLNAQIEAGAQAVQILIPGAARWPTVFTRNFL